MRVPVKDERACTTRLSNRNVGNGPLLALHGRYACAQAPATRTASRWRSASGASESLVFVCSLCLTIRCPSGMEYHYGKHHQAYVTNLNNLIKGTEFEKLPLEDVIRKVSV